MAANSSYHYTLHSIDTDAVKLLTNQNLEERGHLEDLGTDGYGLDSGGWGQNPKAGASEHGN
jgi:hypothetical protein